MTNTTNTASTNITVIDREAQRVPEFRIETDEGSALHVGGEGAAHAYNLLLAKRLSGYFNCPEFKCAVMEKGHFKFHPEDCAPPAIIVPTLAARSVTVNMKDPYSNNEFPVKTTAPVGSLITSKVASDALMVSLAVETYDAQRDGRLSEATLMQEIKSIADQIDRHVVSLIMETLESGANGVGDPKQYYVQLKQELPSGVSPSVKAEVIEDGLYAALDKMKQTGSTIQDYIIGLSTEAHRVCERAARKAGFASVTEWLGTDCYQFVPPVDAPATALYVVPKRCTAVSFREPANGKVFDFQVTRNAAKQSSVMEVNAVADLIIQGFVSVDADGHDTVDVALPLITKVVFDVPSAPVVDVRPHPETKPAQKPQCQPK